MSSFSGAEPMGAQEQFPVQGCWLVVGVRQGDYASVA